MLSSKIEAQCNRHNVKGWGVILAYDAVATQFTEAGIEIVGVRDNPLDFFRQGNVRCGASTGLLRICKGGSSTTKQPARVSEWHLCCPHD